MKNLKVTKKELIEKKTALTKNELQSIRGGVKAKLKNIIIK